MGEFSAHRVTLTAGERVAITTHINLYVSPYGDDVLNSGIEEGSPFRTPQRAVQWLGDKLITETGFVTINFAGGIYDLDSQIEISHDQGDRVAFIGADPDTLLLQSVTYYNTTDIGTIGRNNTQPGFYKFYSATDHGITLNCVRPNDATGFTGLTGSNAISTSIGFSGAGVLIEDFDLVFDADYNPIYYYASYPFHPRNNIARCSSILGAHKLTGFSGNQVIITSSIRDSWVGLPHAIAGTADIGYARWYGNQMEDLLFANGGWGFGVFPFDPSSDTTELQTNNEILEYSFLPNSRSHYLSSIPIGYYGLPTTTGIPIGATANLVGATFPTGNAVGSTAGYIYQGITLTNLVGWFTATGPAGSFLNDTILFGKNYHEHNLATGRFSHIYPLFSVNTNRFTVKLTPTVFRRYGNILKIGGAGLRKVKNIFFDGVSMYSHYKLQGSNENGSSNKAAIYAVNCRLGEHVTNEPTDLGYGFATNSGAKDFHVGFYADRGANAVLGKFVVSNCSYGIIANNSSTVQTVGSVSTGSAACGFGAFNSSNIVADRCFASFCGQSLVNIRIRYAGFTLDENSYIPGQTFETNESPSAGYTAASARIKGTVWEWDPRDKTLMIAVRAGFFEAVNPYLQGVTGQGGQ